MMTAPISSFFVACVLKNAGRQARDWFEQAVDGVRLPFNRENFVRLFSAAFRHLGRGIVELEAQDFLEAGVPCIPVHWGLDAIGRAGLLIKAIEILPAKEHHDLLIELYYKGDNREREVVLRTLPFLQNEERFIPLAVDACRSHVQTIFEAIACENPFPAAHLPDPNFYQMVLKALHTGVAVDRIVGWRERNSTVLARMATDYANERRAAGRSVPPDIERIINQARSDS